MIRSAESFSVVNSGRRIWVRGSNTTGMMPRPQLSFPHIIPDDISIGQEKVFPKKIHPPIRKVVKSYIDPSNIDFDFDAEMAKIEAEIAEAKSLVAELKSVRKKSTEEIVSSIVGMV